MSWQLSISALYYGLAFTLLSFLLAQTWARLAFKPMEDTSSQLVICEEGLSASVKGELERQALEDTSSNIQVTSLDPSYANSEKRTRISKDYRRSRRNNAKANTKARREPRKERRTPAAKPSAPGNPDGLRRYDDYRSRQCRGCGHGRQPRWPEELESAFVEALDFIGPLGRTQIPIDGKYYGVNKLIGEYVHMKTGIYRLRKEISSHKQVVKGHLGDEEWVAKLVAARKEAGSNERGEGLSNEEKMDQLVAYIKNKYDGRADLPSRGTRRSKPDMSDGGSQSSPPAHAYQSRVRPVEFSMWMQDHTQLHSSVANSLHVYTSVAPGQPAPPIPLDSIEGWSVYFPDLLALHQDGAVESEITLLEASLNLSLLSPPAVLATEFELLAAPAFANHSWTCKTNIYCSGRRVWESHPVSVPHVYASSGDGSVRLKPPFDADFWAQMLVHLEERIAKDGRAGEERARRHMQNMSAVQELVAVPNTSGDGTPVRAAGVRVALFLWRFSKTKGTRETGRTTWRHVIPPAPVVLATTAPAPPTPDSVAPPPPPPAPPSAPIEVSGDWLMPQIWDQTGWDGPLDMGDTAAEALEQKATDDAAMASVLANIPLGVLAPPCYPSFDPTTSFESQPVSETPLTLGIPSSSLLLDGSATASFEDGVTPTITFPTCSEEAAAAAAAAAYDAPLWTDYGLSLQAPMMLEQTRSFLDGDNEANKENESFGLIF